MHGTLHAILLTVLEFDLLATFFHKSRRVFLLCIEFFKLFFHLDFRIIRILCLICVTISSLLFALSQFLVCVSFILLLSKHFLTCLDTSLCLLLIYSGASINHSSLCSESTFGTFSIGYCVYIFSLLVIHNSILNSLIGRSLLLKEDEMLLVIIQFSVELKLVDCCVRVCAILNHKLK